MFFDFQAQKVLLKAEIEGTPGILAQAGSIFWICTLVVSILSTCGSEMDAEWQSYDRFSEHRSILWQSVKELHFPMTLFASPPPKFCILDSGDIVSTYILADARNALSFLAVTHISYYTSHGENKKNKAYSRWIYLNLWPNGIARIIEHLQKPMFALTTGTNVYNQRNLSNFLQKEVPMGWETCPKTAANDVLWLSGPKTPA